MFSSSPPMFCPISRLWTDGITPSFAYSDSTKRDLSGDISFIGSRCIFVRNNTMFSSSPDVLPHFSASTARNHFILCIFGIYSTRPIWWYILHGANVGISDRCPFFGDVIPHFRASTERNRFNLFGFEIYSLIPIRWYAFHEEIRRKMSWHSEMRISGQGLARLVQSGHNKAKQSPFPTTWRERLKEQNDYTVSSFGLVLLYRRLNAGINLLV